MGGGKETPRQKMVGLMYLVLMALLAMNVSKEIINAFVTLNNKLESQNVTVANSNDARLGIFDQQLATLKATGGTEEDAANIKLWQAKAVEAHNSTRFAVNAVMGMAKEMLDQGGPGEWVVEDENKLMYIVDLNNKEAEYPKKDDYDTPSRMFGPSELGGENKAADLLAAVYNYRDSLCSKMALMTKDGKDYSFTAPESHERATAEDTTYYSSQLDEALTTAHPDVHNKIREIYKMLTFPTKVLNHGELVPWGQGQFDHSPMVAAAALLTSIKGQILQAETVALDHFSSQNSVPPFEFDTIEAKAFASTGYINVGDSLNLSVRIAAYDSKADTKLRYWKDSAKTGDPIISNVNDIKFGGSTGKHFVYGDIEVKEKGKKVWKPWDFSYEVGSPSGAIGNYEMKVLYKGYENKIVASGSGFPKVEASCSGCSLSKTSFNGVDGYIAKVSSGNKATITVKGVNDDGSSAVIAQEDFRILQLPTPTGMVSTAKGKSKVSKGQLKANTKIVAELVGSPLQVKYTVISFEMQYVNASTGRVVRKKGKNMITSDMANLIKKVKPGTPIVFADMKVKYPSGGAKFIPSLAITVR